MRRFPCRGVVIGACITAGVAAGSQAQTTQGIPTSTINRGISPVPTTASGRGISLVPTLTVDETLTDNVNLSSSDRRVDLVTHVTPGIRFDSTGGRVKGFAEYSLTGVAYARHSASNEIQNLLNAAVSVEALEKRAFVDVAANISQQVISAFGTRASDPSLINGNRTEVRTLSISPYIVGRLADWADYEARFTATRERNSTTEAANNDTSLATVRLTRERGGKFVSWSVDASHQVYDYSAGRRTYDDIARAKLFFDVNPALRLTAIGGVESTNIGTVDKETHSTPGLGIDWRPTERTRFSAQYQKRFFGDSHSLVFEHRTPRTVWRFTDTDDITTGFGQPVLGSLGTAYDLFFSQFASIQPDPALRASLVQAFLGANGIAPNAQVFTGSLSSAVTRERRQELSFALLGIRDIVTFAASQVQGLRLDNVAPAIDDFTNSNLVRQRAVSVSLSHRLTPLVVLDVIASVDRVSGNLPSQSTTLRSLHVNWTQPLLPRVNLTLAARHSSFSSPTQPYSESALSAIVALRF